MFSKGGKVPEDERLRIAANTRLTSGSLPLYSTSLNEFPLLASAYITAAGPSNASKAAVRV